MKKANESEKGSSKKPSLKQGETVSAEMRKKRGFHWVHKLSRREAAIEALCGELGYYGHKGIDEKSFMEQSLFSREVARLMPALMERQLVERIPGGRLRLKIMPDSPFRVCLNNIDKLNSAILDAQGLLTLIGHRHADDNANSKEIPKREAGMLFRRACEAANALETESQALYEKLKSIEVPTPIHERRRV